MSDLDFPTEKELIDFVEGFDPPEQQKYIRNLMVASPQVRENVANVRRDLYRVLCQIPRAEPSVEFQLEINKLAEIWTQVRRQRSNRMRNFLFGKEFFSLAFLFTIVLLFTIMLLWVR